MKLINKKKLIVNPQKLLYTQAISIIGENLWGCQKNYKKLQSVTGELE